MQKRVCLYVFFVCISINIKGQIHALPQVETSNNTVERYDSLSNILPTKKDDYSFLIGQRLFLYADTIDFKSYGGGAFYKMNTGKKKQPYIEQPYINYLSKSLEVIGIENYGYGGEYLSLKLLNVENKDTVYFRGSRGIYGRYWTTEGFFKKTQQDFISKDFYLVKDYKRYNSKNWFYELNTDKPAEALRRGTKLSCIDVALKISKEPRNSIIASIVVLVFKDEDGKKYYIYLEKADIYRSSIIRDRRTLDLLISSEEMAKRENEEKTKLENLKSLYGNEVGTNIYIGKVELGYTTTMCREAWGIPLDINTTTGSFGTHEQWVYSNNRYLYFENGKLTVIQD